MRKLLSKVPVTYTNLLLMMIGEGIVKFVQLLINIAIARVVSVGSFGVFNNIFIITQTISIISDFGMTIVLVRDIANKAMSPTKTFETYFIFKLVLSLVLTMACIGIGITADRSNLVLYVILGMYNILQQGFLTYLYSLFRGQKDFKTETISKILNVIGFIIGFIFFWIKKDRTTAGLPYLLSVVLPSVCLLFLIKIKLKPKLKIVSMKKYYVMFKRILPTGIAQVTNVLPLNIPNIYSRLFLGDYETGIYSAAIKLILPLTMLSVIANNVFLPSISKGEGVLTSRAKKLAISFSIAFITFSEIFAPQIVQVIYGNKYHDVTSLLRVLIFFPFIYFLNQFLGNKILSQKKDTLYTVTVLLPVVIIFGFFLFFHLNNTLDLMAITLLPLFTETFSLVMRLATLTYFRIQPQAI